MNDSYVYVVDKHSSSTLKSRANSDQPGVYLPSLDHPTEDPTEKNTGLVSSDDLLFYHLYDNDYDHLATSYDSSDSTNIPTPSFSTKNDFSDLYYYQRKYSITLVSPSESESTKSQSEEKEQLSDQYSIPFWCLLDYKNNNFECTILYSLNDVATNINVFIKRLKYHIKLLYNISKYSIILDQIIATHQLNNDVIITEQKSISYSLFFIE